MSEIEQLKKRIKNSNYDGIETSVIRDDYEPAGQMMINQLVESGEFITHRSMGEFIGLYDGAWKIWAKNFSPKF